MSFTFIAPYSLSIIRNAIIVHIAWNNIWLTANMYLFTFLWGGGGKEEEEVYKGYNRHIVGQHSWLLFPLQFFKICLLINYVEKPWTSEKVAVF